ncbi:MAG TPA: hypothetical protein VLB29_02180 [Nocardioidaceae bacterium]|nr:hypothetical protein [Nocardioidaceae bacterium]
MTTKALALPRWARRALVAAGLFQLTMRVAGLVAAHRLDLGDASSARIRRVKTLGQAVLRPESHELARIEVDLVLAGVELDLTKAQPAVGGIDLLLKCVLGGGDVRVPAHWRLYWESRGAGGVTVKGGLTAPDPASADLRIALSALAGGVTIREV